MNRTFAISALLLLIVSIGSQAMISENVSASQIHSPSRAAQRLNTDMEEEGKTTVIGNGSDNSSYEIFTSMTIAIGQNLTFVNCNIYVAENVTIAVHGSLTLISSRLVETTAGAYPSHSVSIFLNGIQGMKANLSLVSSSLTFSGSITGNNSSIWIRNSTIDTSWENSWISYSFVSSNLYVNNSEIMGLHGEDSNFLKSMGNQYSLGYPIAKSGYLNVKSVADGNIPLSSLNVSVLVSGNNPGGSDFLNLIIPGNPIMKVVLPSTPSLTNKEWVNLSINLTTPSSVSSIISNSSKEIYYNFSYETGSNLSIWNVTIGFVSDDIVDFLGYSSFNYILSNSTMISFNSSFILSNLSSGSLIPNSGDHMFLLRNHSRLDLETAGTSVSSFPFEFSSGSEAFLYGEVNVYVESSGRIVNGEQISVIPFASDQGKSNLLDQVIPSTGNRKASAFFVLSEIISETDQGYFGDYAIEAMGNNMTIATISGVAILNNPEINATIKPRLPQAAISIYGYGDLPGECYVNFVINGSFPDGGNKSASLKIWNSVTMLKTELPINSTGTIYNATFNNSAFLNGKFNLSVCVSYSGSFTVSNFSYYRGTLNLTGLSYIPSVVSFRMISPWSGDISLSRYFLPEGTSGYVRMDFTGFHNLSIARNLALNGSVNYTDLPIPVNATALSITIALGTGKGNFIDSIPYVENVESDRNNLTERMDLILHGIGENSTWNVSIGGKISEETGNMAVLDVPYSHDTAIVLPPLFFMPKILLIDLNWNKTVYSVNLSRQNFTLQFDENHRTASGVNFTVEVKGIGNYSGTDSVTIILPEGKYTISIVPESGFLSSQQTLNLTMQGNLTILVSFSRVQYGPDYDQYALPALALSGFAALLVGVRRYSRARICRHCGIRLDGKKSKRDGN